MNQRKIADELIKQFADQNKERLEVIYERQDSNSGDVLEHVNAR